MTNLDVMAKILSEVAGNTPSHWRHVIQAGLAASGTDIATQTTLLEHLSQDEAQQLLHTLRSEKQGIRMWLVQGRVAALNATPEVKSRVATFLGNGQN